MMVDSSWIKNITYSTNVLTITTHSGRVYAYHGVPQSLYDAFKHTGDKGEFFHRHIKGKYVTADIT